MTRYVILQLLVFSALPVFAEEQWPRFRGPQGHGVSAAVIPVKWTDTQFKWKTPLPATGHGSPIVWGDNVFLLCADEETGTRSAVAVHAHTGKILWTLDYPAQHHRHHKENSFASSTPAADADRVYFAWGTPKSLQLTALSHAGKQLWQSDLGPVKGGHGFGASPIVYGDLIILNNDQDGDSSLIAVHKATGKIVWQTPRKSKRLTYSTPTPYKASGRDEELIFTNWTHGITGIDPKTGKVKWENVVFNLSSPERAIGSPIVAGDLVIGTCGFVTKLKHIVALRPKGKQMEEVWRIEKSVPHIPTPLLLGENLFLWNDQGIVSCVEVATGKVHWNERAVRSGRFFGSPVAAAGNIFCIDSNGKTIVMRGDGKFEILAVNDLDERCNATPAIAHQRMYIRTYGHLIAVGQ